MNQSLSRKQSILLGFAMLVLLASAVLGLTAIGSRQWAWGQVFHVRAGFLDIRGIEVGTRVRVQGIEAGEVDSIQPPRQPGEEVMVRLRIDGRMRSLLRGDASVRIVSEGMIGGKVLEIDPGSAQAAPIEEDGQLRAQQAAELGDVLAEMKETLRGIRQSEGTIGKLLTDPAGFTSAVKALEQGRETLHSVQQTSDALKKFPLVRNYVEDSLELLIRPQAERNRRWFAEADLFEPGRAVLTGPGRERLDQLAPWLAGLKHKNSDIVVASYADPATTPAALAQSLTRHQSEAVCTYLREQHAVQKMGWFTARKVTPLGCGINPAPVAETEKLPPARVEVLVFVPQT